MKKQHTSWRPLDDPFVDQIFEVSNFGDFRIIGNEEFIEPYHSSNGYDYQFITFPDNPIGCLKRLDIITASVFIDIPEYLIGLPRNVIHKDGNNRNNSIDNLEWIEDIEIWKTLNLPFIKSTGYQISSWGRVISPSGLFIKGTMHNGGYPSIMLRLNNGKRKMFGIHRLVAWLFMGYEDGKVINHIDGDKMNNDLYNLEIVTKAQNNKHAAKFDLKGSIKHGDIRLIRDLLIYHEGSPSEVLKSLNDSGIVNITESMIRNHKNKMIQEGFNFSIRQKVKLTKDIRNIIEKLLVFYNGDCNKVLEELHKRGITDIFVYNIGTVRASINNKYKFPDGKLNRKINTSERLKLIKVLKDNDMSPAKTYEAIRKSHEFDNVSIYDLKYIKRKLIKDILMRAFSSHQSLVSSLKSLEHFP